MRAPAPRVQLLAGLALVLGVGLALRAWRLQEVPQVTDESSEVLFAWDIAFNGARPLTHTDSYDGPLWPYLTAALLRLVGPDAGVPRRAALAWGLAALVATYALGAALAGPAQRTAGAVVAGLLLATQYTSALVTSRVAWSNSTTPFWTTATTLALLWAVRGGGGALRQAARWVIAGLGAGLALQTHPSVIAFLLAMAMWLLLAAGRRRLLATPGPWLGVLAACAAFSPVVVHNVRQPLETFQEVGASANLVTRPGVGQWLATAPRAAAQLGRSFVGGWDVAGVPAGGPGPWLTLAAVLAVVGFVVLAARWHTPETPGRRLPLVAVVASATILPLVNGNWEGFLEARYLGFLAPLAAAAAGAVVSEVVHRPGWRRSVAAAAAGFLVVVPAVAVPRDIRAAEAAGRDNRALFAVVAAAREAAGAGSAVWLASDLKELPWQGRGDPRRATAYYLTLSHVPFDVAPTDKLRYFVDQGTPIVFVASADLAAHLARAGRVTPVALSRVAGFPEWGLYRSP